MTCAHREGGHGYCESSKDYARIDGGGQSAAANRCGLQGHLNVAIAIDHIGLGGGRASNTALRARGVARRVQPDRSPLRCRRLCGCRLGRNQRRINLEDAQLAIARSSGRFIAQRTLGQSRTGLACRNQLARELNQVRRQRFRRPGRLLEHRSLPKSNLFVQRLSLGVVAFDLRISTRQADPGPRRPNVRGARSVFIQPHGQSRRRWLLNTLRLRGRTPCRDSSRCLSFCRRNGNFRPQA